MSLLSGGLKQAGRLLHTFLPGTIKPCLAGQAKLLSTTAFLADKDKKEESVRYRAYPEYETPSPFVDNTDFYKYKYKYKLHTGGVKPRPKEMEDEPIRLPYYQPKDSWESRKALFGQNDYIDILGDGSIHPAELIQAPSYIKAFKGNELQRNIRRLQFQGAYLREFYPEKYHRITTKIHRLWKRHNVKRRHAPFWSGGKAKTSRIDAPWRIR